MYCGPHHRICGKRLATRICNMVRNAGDQLEGGPSGVLAQSKVRIRSAISPPPERKGAAGMNGAGTRSFLAVASFILHLCKNKRLLCPAQPREEASRASKERRRGCGPPLLSQTLLFAFEEGARQDSGQRK